jgi:hypothetical protein
LSVEDELALGVELLESAEELATEDVGEGVNGKEEAGALAAWDPGLCVVSEASGGDDAVQVGWKRRSRVQVWRTAVTPS